MSDLLESSEQQLLTTVDNPYNPFTEFDKWLIFDTQKGYNTCGLLERFVVASPELSDVDEQLAIKRAMNRVIELNVYGVHRIVTRSFFDKKE